MHLCKTQRNEIQSNRTNSTVVVPIHCSMAGGDMCSKALKACDIQFGISWHCAHLIFPSVCDRVHRNALCSFCSFAFRISPSVSPFHSLFLDVCVFTSLHYLSSVFQIICNQVVAMKSIHWPAMLLLLHSDMIIMAATATATQINNSFY